MLVGIDDTSGALPCIFSALLVGLTARAIRLIGCRVGTGSEAGACWCSLFVVHIVLLRQGTSGAFTSRVWCGRWRWGSVWTIKLDSFALVSSPSSAILGQEATIKVEGATVRTGLNPSCAGVSGWAFLVGESVGGGVIA